MSKDEQFAFIIITDLLFFALALFVSGGITTINGGNTAIRYGPSTTVVYPNGTEVYHQVSQFVPMAQAEVIGIWLLFIGFVLLWDYFIFASDGIVKLFNNQFRFTVIRPMTPEEIENRTEWFRLKLKSKSAELEKEQPKA